MFSSAKLNTLSSIHNSVGTDQSISPLFADLPSPTTGSSPRSMVGSSNLMSALRPKLESQKDKVWKQKPEKYKTELCRTFEDHNWCKYGSRCQFAHGLAELRQAERHPKYKTQLCNGFHSIGYCKYGTRCQFVHNICSQQV